MRMSEMLKDKKVLESFIRVFVNEANTCAMSDNERMEALHKAIAKNDASALCEALTGCELMFLLGKAVERAKFAPTSGGFSEHPTEPAAENDEPAKPKSQGKKASWYACTVLQTIKRNKEWNSTSFFINIPTDVEKKKSYMIEQLKKAAKEFLRSDFGRRFFEKSDHTVMNINDVFCGLSEAQLKKLGIVIEFEQAPRVADSLFLDIHPLFLMDEIVRKEIAPKEYLHIADFIDDVQSFSKTLAAVEHYTNSNENVGKNILELQYKLEDSMKDLHTHHGIIMEDMVRSACNSFTGCYLKDADDCPFIEGHCLNMDKVTLDGLTEEEKKEYDRNVRHLIVNYFSGLVRYLPNLIGCEQNRSNDVKWRNAELHKVRFKDYDVTIAFSTEQGRDAFVDEFIDELPLYELL